MNLVSTTAWPREMALAGRWRSDLLDWAERAAMLALYGWLVFRMVADYLGTGAIGSLILLPSEGVVVFFLLIRRRAMTLSRRKTDWALAIVGTMAPLCIQPAVGHAILPPAVAASLMLAGMFVQVSAKLVLGRSFGCVAADRGVKSGGPYRYVRHPMYAGYLLTHLGFLAANATGWNVLVYAVCYMHQIPRLLAEERLLIRDRRYRVYMNGVRYRLIPGVF